MGCMWRICARNRCSLWMTRSITSLKDAGGGAESLPPLCPAALFDVTWGAEGTESCESAGKDDTNTNHSESKPTCTIRIKTFGSNSCQLKNNMQDDGGIGGVAIPRRRLETNLFGCFHRVVIEAVTQPMHHAHHPQATRGLQNYLEKNFAFNSQVACLLRIDRSGFPKYFSRHSGVGRFRRMRAHGGRSRNVGVAEATGLNGVRRCRSPRTIIASGRAPAKTGTCCHAAHSLGAAAAVTVASSRRQIEGSKRSHVHGFPLIGLGRNSIGIAEASGLQLRRSARDGGRSRTAGGEYVRPDYSRDHRRGVERKRVQFFGRDADRGSGSVFHFYRSRLWRGQAQSVGRGIEIRDEYRLRQMAQRLWLMIDWNRSAHQLNRTERVLGSGDNYWLQYSQPHQKRGQAGLRPRAENEFLPGSSGLWEQREQNLLRSRISHDC